jgi:murein DD-endopeptidase MepM/ murein hydrolase activator NlpD
VRALFAALVLLAACAAPDAPASDETAAGETSAPIIEESEAPPEMLAPAGPPPAPTELTLNCAGAFTQGGVALCRTLPGAAISVDGVASGEADANGWAVIGFTRTHGAQGRVEARAQAASVSQSYAIAPREFDIQRVDGLPPQTVTPTDPAVLARIQREAALKQVGFASIAPLEGWLDGFIQPVEGRVSGRWGNQRILNGVPASPHFGYDIAAPEGTPIRAPAAGLVTLANPDMHYEGGLVFIDHGQGLITMYLHMSRLDVAVGDTVEQGQVIGAVGARGRATGPHLCWRMKWRERQLDPSVAIEGLATARAQLLASTQ